MPTCPPGEPPGGATPAGAAQVGGLPLRPPNNAAAIFSFSHRAAYSAALSCGAAGAGAVAHPKRPPMPPPAALDEDGFGAVLLLLPPAAVPPGEPAGVAWPKPVFADELTCPL